MENKDELYKIDKEIEILNNRIKNLEKKKEQVILEEKEKMEKLKEPIKKILKEIENKESEIINEINKFIGKQILCNDCEYGDNDGEKNPGIDFKCPLSNYCKYYDGYLNIYELLDNES